jgi:hypothetical protein
LPLLPAVLVVVMTTIVGGQLIVAATLKLRGFHAYTAAIGSKRSAYLVVGVDSALGTWCLLGRPYGQIMWVVVGAFFTLGAVHRTQVVLSPARTSCLCAHPAKTTEWPDVASNVVIAVAAVLFGAVNWRTPTWFAPVAMIAEVIFVCACVHAASQGKAHRAKRLSNPTRVTPQ